MKVNVARSPEEADLQAQGVDVLQQMFEEEAAPIAAEDARTDAETARNRGAAAEEALPPSEAAEAPAAEGEGEQA